MIKIKEVPQIERLLEQIAISRPIGSINVV